MSEIRSLPDGTLDQVARVLGLGGAARLIDLKPSTLAGLPLRDLLVAAGLLGLTRVSKLKKEALLARVWEAMVEAGVVVAPAAAEPAAARPRPAVTPPSRPRATPPGSKAVVAPATVHGEEPSSGPGLTRKFDLGRAKPAPAVDHIPWSYGHDRIAAMPVDPERLFVYWEVTDDAIAKARAGLGAGGPAAWLNLRVYDITGRLFDGTNAWGYFDHRPDGDTRQWFFSIGKPTSEVVVEVGLRSHEGYFSKIARSGRVEFPRRSPAMGDEPEWITVREHANVEHAGFSARVLPPIAPAWSDPVEPMVADGQAPVAAGVLPHSMEQDLAAAKRVLDDMVPAGSWQEIVTTVTGGAVHADVHWESLPQAGLPPLPGVGVPGSWEGPVSRTSWEIGPFAHPVEVPPPSASVWTGPSRVFHAGGRTHVIEGPWQVTIRGLGARRGHRVLARWDIYRSVRTEISPQSWTGPSMKIGSSERMIGSSDLRLGGASEQFYAGASDLMFRGASERQLGGASEQVVQRSGGGFPEGPASGEGR